MLNYLTQAEIIAHSGLRIVLVQGLPSPWGQSAKTLFEIKGLPYAAAPWMAGETNQAIVDWSHADSAPVVAWRDEPPVNRWFDILFLAERLAPTPALIPADAKQRALMLGLAHEICGELGIGWNRRLQMFAPMLDSGQAPAGVQLMGRKYRYTKEDAVRAGARTADQLKVLAEQLHAQAARGVHYFVGDSLSALDIYWTMFANLLEPLPREQCPMPDDWRPMFVATDPQIRAALDPLLLQHRDRIFATHCRNPMEL
ncbi:MAG: glutathione S-transferase family protein [Gammaproteobacteria bacterium]